MANDLTATGGTDGATVTLNADAGPFEQALDKAAEKVSGWGRSIEGRFSKISTAIQSRTEGMAKLFGSINEKAEQGMSAAGAIGGTLGGALGMRFGPIGSKIGEQLGQGIAEGLADSVDFAGALAGANSLQSAVKDEVEKTKDAWGAFKYSAEQRFKEIRDIFGELNLTELIRGDAESAGKKLEDVFGRAGERAELLLGQGMARIADRVNEAFERVKQPVAGVADFLQAIGQQLGLVESGTQSWGDAIRNLEDVGDKAFKGIGRAIGYLEAMLVKVGAGVTKSLAEPITRALEVVLSAARNALDAAAQISPFGDEKLKQWSAGLKEAEGRIRNFGDAAMAKADEMLAVSVEDRMKWWEEKFGSMLASGRSKNMMDDIERAVLAGAGGEASMDKAAANDPMKAVNAMIGGSSAANQAIIAAQRSTFNAAAQAPEVQAVKKLDEMKKQDELAAKENAALLGEVREAIDRLSEVLTSGE